MSRTMYLGAALLIAGTVMAPRDAMGAGNPPGCGAESLVQYLDPNWQIGGGCLTPQGNASRAASWARAYTFADPFDVQCVEFGCINYDAPWSVTVNLLLGDPSGAYHDLTVLASRDATVPNNASDTERDPILVSFASEDGFPRVTPGQTLVVEVVSRSRAVAAGGDGGTLLLGFNQGGETGPSYYRSEDCGVPDLETVFSLTGNPTWAWILSVHGTAATCLADLTGDGAVNGGDLGALLTAWGLAPESTADFTGDGRVDGADLGILLDAWGNCP